MSDNYTRAITITRVIDGDTVMADVDLGYHAMVKAVTYRLARVNTPELHGKDRPAAIAASAYTEDWLTIHGKHGGLFATTTKTDDWRRWIAEVTCGQGHGLSDDLLASANAVPYAGK